MATGTTAAEAGTTPLVIRLDDVAPGTLPRRGRVVVTGSVTNDDEVPWTRVNVYSFLGADPIDDAAELEEASLTAEDLPVGDRITDPGSYATIESLEPGGTASFRVRVPSRLLLERLAPTGGEPQPGVYWFGVHALGESPDGRDEFTDGRARTFLPVLPADAADAPVPLSLVVPLRTPVAHAPDGSLADPAAWAERLGVGGELRDRVDFGAASGAEPVSWLIDPSVVAAATRLAAANPPRDLGPTPTDGSTDGTPDPSADPSADPSEDTSGTPSGSSGSGSSPGPVAPEDASTAPAPSDATDPAEPADPGSVPPDTGDPATSEAAERALSWLALLESEVGGDQVLALPYGDLDVAGALAAAPDLYADARRRSSTTIRPLAGASGSAAVPVVAPPGGHLTPEVLRGLDQQDAGALRLGSDDLVPGVAPSLAVVDGRPVVLASTGAESGGPGPTPRTSSLALRQRILAEAALRLVDPAAAPVPGVGPDPGAGPAADQGPAPTPLVVVMPQDWQAEDGAAFFAGLADAGVDLVPLTAAADQDGVRVDAADLADTGSAGPEPLGEEVFAAVRALRRAGETLQNLLAVNSQVAAAVDDEALVLASYQDREDPAGSIASARASQLWIGERLGAVRIEAPEGVTLSGASGSFSATVVNGLDEPVSVGLVPVVDGGIRVVTPPGLELPPGGRTTVVVEAQDAEPGIHDVTLRLVDTDGRALPAAAALPIRSAQVSNVIWLILATGVGLLVVAIVLRAVRRVRRARGAPAPPAAGTP